MPGGCVPMHEAPRCPAQQTGQYAALSRLTHDMQLLHCAAGQVLPDRYIIVQSTAEFQADMLHLFHAAVGRCFHLHRQFKPHGDRPRQPNSSVLFDVLVQPMFANLCQQRHRHHHHFHPWH